ncbi:MAG: vWA domain-containing protein, partial [Bacteroidota bacterium]
MPDISFSSSFSLLLILGAAAVSGVLATVLYRITVPPVPNLTRWILTVLRGVVVFLVFFLIGEPLVSVTETREILPAVAVLVDDSRSMTIRDGGGDRSQILRDVLASRAVERLSEIGTVLPFAFDGTLRLLGSLSMDSLSLDGDETDIAGAVRALRSEGAVHAVRAAVLMSDGIPTSGSHPLFDAEDLGIPLFTIGIGDTTDQRDVLVRRVLTNSIAYVGTRVPVQIGITSSGFDGERVEVTLGTEGRVIDRSLLTLGSGIRDYSLTLWYEPEAEGRQRLTVAVTSLPGEVTDRNNRQSVSITVLKSKMKVVLIAGAPGPDVAFIRRALESDDNVEVIARIERRDGRFSEGTMTPDLLREADCVVLVGYPGPSTTGGSLQLVADAVSGGKGLLMVLTRTVDLQRLRSIESVLPFTVAGTGGEEYEAFATLEPAYRTHAILQLPGTENPETVWGRLAPVFRLRVSLRAKPEAEVLVTTR